MLGACGQHSVACTCHFSRLFYILCTLVVLHRTCLHVCTMSLLLTCHMHIQHVCLVIRFPRLSGYFCGKQMCAVKRGLTVHVCVFVCPCVYVCARMYVLVTHVTACVRSHHPQLGLMKIRDTRIGSPITGTRGISGGEAKRLAFASEVCILVHSHFPCFPACFPPPHSPPPPPPALLYS